MGKLAKRARYSNPSGPLVRSWLATTPSRSQEYTVTTTAWNKTTLSKHREPRRFRNLSVNERKVVLLVEVDFLQSLLKSDETFIDKVLVVLHFDPLVSRVSVDEADGPGHGDPPLVLPPIVRTTVDLDMENHGIII